MCMEVIITEHNINNTLSLMKRNNYLSTVLKGEGEGEGEAGNWVGRRARDSKDDGEGYGEIGKEKGGDLVVWIKSG